jgi:hypothetical protein
MATVTCSGLLRVGRLAAPAVAVPRPEGEEGRRRKLERLKLNFEIVKRIAIRKGKLFPQKKEIILGLLDQITVFMYTMDICNRKFATEHRYIFSDVCLNIPPNCVFVKYHCSFALHLPKNTRLKQKFLTFIVEFIRLSNKMYIFVCVYTVTPQNYNCIWQKHNWALCFEKPIWITAVDASTA